ncbi:MAG: hypothetical protein GXP42_10965 [Chloroflexi bacterium]|nr:hypothetical protein [Chloroflexota bacterium]
MTFKKRGDESRPPEKTWQGATQFPAPDEQNSMRRKKMSGRSREAGENETIMNENKGQSP